MGLVLASLGLTWFFGGVRVMADKASSMGFRGHAMPETRVSQGGILAVSGLGCVGLAIYLVWFYDRD